MATVNDIIKLALKDAGVLGVGQSPLPEDSNDAFETVNEMLAEWSLDEFYVYFIQSMSLTSTGATSYTIGPGGDFDTVLDQRPNRINSAFVRQPVAGAQPVDYILIPIFSREDYNRISVKETVSLSDSYFYEASFPLGRIYTWPVLDATTYELHISFKQRLAQFTSLSQTISLPLEYKSLIRYNAAERIAGGYSLPVTPAVARMAANTRKLVKSSNFRVTELTTPVPTTGPGGRYNILGDRYS